MCHYEKKKKKLAWCLSTTCQMCNIMGLWVYKNISYWMQLLYTEWDFCFSILCISNVHSRSCSSTIVSWGQFTSQEISHFLLRPQYLPWHPAPPEGKIKPSFNIEFKTDIRGAGMFFLIYFVSHAWHVPDKHVMVLRWYIDSLLSALSGRGLRGSYDNKVT